MRGCGHSRSSAPEGAVSLARFARSLPDLLPCTSFIFLFLSFGSAMGDPPPRRRSLVRALLGAFLVVVSLCSADAAASSNEKIVTVVGAGQCADCASRNIKDSDAFNELHVVINCKAGEGVYQIRGFSKLNKDGKFTVKLPTELVKEDGELKAECYAQLHGGSKNAPCPSAQGGLEAAKLVLKSRDGGKHTFGTAGKLSFSSETCSAAFFWHHPWFKPIPKYPGKPYPWKPYPFPPKPYFPPKVYPPVYMPPVYQTPPVYSPPPAPVYKPPPVYSPPPVYHPPPVYSPPPVYHAPPVYSPPPVYKPPPVYSPPPVYKPPLYLPPPIYKPPCPPVYIYKPPIPKFPPYPPVYKKSWPVPKFPPVYQKPLPPIPKLPPYPPVYKKSWPIPKFPPVYQKPLPPIPKLPPKYFYPHPKFGFPPPYGWPPMSHSATPTHTVPKHPATEAGKPKP